MPCGGSWTADSVKDVERAVRSPSKWSGRPSGVSVRVSRQICWAARPIPIVDDIVLWTYNIYEQTPVNVIKEIHLKQFFSQVHTNLSSNDIFILSLPNGERNITHIFACFLQKNKGTVKCSSNDFSDGYTNIYPEVKVGTLAGGYFGAVSTLQMIDSNLFSFEMVAIAYVHLWKKSTNEKKKRNKLQRTKRIKRLVLKETKKDGSKYKPIIKRRKEKDRKMENKINKQKHDKAIYI